jgi:hypothetical protein
MRPRSLVIAVLCGACGSVADNVPSDGPVDGAPMPTTYRGRVDETSPPVMFGQPPTTCSWKMTLRDLEIDLGILPSGQVANGQVHALYHEELADLCSDPAAPPSIIDYTFTASVPASGGMTLTFQEEVGDSPGASLSALLTSAGSGYQMQLSFERTDLPARYKWMLVTSAVLSKP